MAGGTVNNGTGVAIVFGTSSFSSELLSIDGSGVSRVSIDTSHHGTAAAGALDFGNMTSIPGDLSDPGAIDIELHFDPDQEPPIDQPAETITITFAKFAADATATIWAASGYMTDFNWGVPLEDKMTATATIKFSGPVSITAAA